MDRSLQSWLLYKSLSASLQFVFSVNCSTYRSIFNVFVVRSELTVLYSAIFISIFFFFTILEAVLEASELGVPVMAQWQ